ncbi:MAG: hypothetical protein HC780_23915 [Leptolyngbyaceae cyanobacterium CSU_1_3]|nr:hypothetical protein [Leptolyngbyaceae cyanobacterium CSU_1_3]
MLTNTVIDCNFERSYTLIQLSSLAFCRASIARDKGKIKVPVTDDFWSEAWHGSALSRWQVNRVLQK